MKKQISIIKISSDTHSKLKKYCRKNALKLYQWVELVLLEKLKNEDKKYE